MQADSTWIREAKWGVFVHFLAEHHLEPTITPKQWNRLVDGFDVEALADQLASVKAGYLIFTIGQNSGYFCAPNPVYDQYVGYPESHCSDRDLLADLYEALSKRGISLLAYLPGGAPDRDAQAVSRLEWGCGGSDRYANFQRKWESICRCWSERWGNKIRGWWIDGCWFGETMYDFDDEPNFRSFAAALKAGNPDSLVSFNPGLRLPAFKSATPYEDMTCGECLDVLYLGTYERDANGEWGEYFDFANGNVNGIQLHLYLSLAGHVKNTPPQLCKPRFPLDLITGYTNYINARGGVISWEAPIESGGTLREPYYEQLKMLGQQR